jgi:hypothetical protein
MLLESPGYETEETTVLAFSRDRLQI